MTLDLSTVKKIAKPWQWIYGKTQENVEGWTFNTEAQLMEFAQACYAMGAQEQKEKDIEVCKEFYSVEGIAQQCVKSIRSNE